MNFRIDIEMTPEELRRALGLPDVAGLQQEMIARVREQMDAVLKVMTRSRCSNPTLITVSARWKPSRNCCSA
jgi:hypothetical protein